jgi:hypothetical protein
LLNTVRRRDVIRAGVFFLLVLAIIALLPQVGHAGNTHKSTFRLGTAAQPFGTSTAIADFDSDHQPDFAIANNIGTSTRGYEYSLEFELSLESRQVFHFHSSYSGLSVSAVDLDNDKDLDVVLTRIANGEVVGVWINNGHGQFTEGPKTSSFPIKLFLSERTVQPIQTEPAFIATTSRRFLLAEPGYSLASDSPLTVCGSLRTVDVNCTYHELQIRLSLRAPPSFA